MRFQESDESNPGQLDFVPRERRNQATQILVAFAVTMALIFVFSYSPSLHQYGPIFAIAVVGALCLYVVTSNQKNIDLVMSTEYQNLLFAQAVTVGNDFTIFARRNGTIVYADKGLREVFGEGYSESQALESIFEKGGISKPDRERLMGSIYNNMSDRAVFPITLPNAQLANYVLTIDPIARPAGYMLIRGREYRDARTGVQVMPNLLRSTSVDKLDHLLGHTPIAHYATDAFGRFEYVSHAFETALGFANGEVLERRLTLLHVLNQLGDQPVGDDYMVGDFDGQAVIRLEDGKLADCLLFQKVIRDEANKPIGATGSIITSTMLDWS